MKFQSLDLDARLLESLKLAGYHTATPIQEQAIPPVLQGRDLIGCAQTGTGKTAAFSLPLLHRLMTTKSAPSGAEKRRQRSGRRAIRALIVAPTRELAAQIGDSLSTYGKGTGLRHTVIFGGVGQNPQVSAVRAGIDILVATPGRLLDLIGQGFIKLGAVEVLILDEADHMLDMGFIHDLKKIVAHVPDKRQTLMFSATMPPEIRQLASQWLRKPVEVSVAAVASTPELVSQSVYFVAKKKKAAALREFLYSTVRDKTIVFSRTKHGADKIAKNLERDGFKALAIHGNKSQSKRQAVIRQFSADNPPVLVATDLAARGLDFTDVSHVINYDMPDTAETYVHRIGRTARAGNSGNAVSFCDGDERNILTMIERLTGHRVPEGDLPEIESSETELSESERSGGNSRRRSGSRNSSNSRPRGSGSADRRRSGRRRGSSTQGSATRGPATQGPATRGGSSDRTTKSNAPDTFGAGIELDNSKNGQQTSRKGTESNSTDSTANAKKKRPGKYARRARAAAKAGKSGSANG